MEMDEVDGKKGITFKNLRKTAKTKFYNQNMVSFKNKVYLCRLNTKEMQTDTYLNMPSVPAGAILYRIAQKQHLAQTALARKTGIIPQRINDLIMGRRRFTPYNSMVLEQALGISHQGFFYLIQANHDVYLTHLSETQAIKPNLDLLSQTTFWDVDLSKINWSESRDWAIRRVLEYGKPKEIKELCRFYGREAFARIGSSPESFRLYDIVLRNLKHVGL